MDIQMKELLGEKTADDDVKPAKKKKEKTPKTEVSKHSITFFLSCFLFY